MGRPKGSRNKIKTEPVEDIMVPGQKDQEIAMSAITDEDLELERALNPIADTLPDILDEAPVAPLKQEFVNPNFLKEHVDDYKPASTVAELLEQVHMAKGLNCDSIEGTPALIRHFCRAHYPDDVGYFIYQDVKVYIPGTFEQSSKRDKMSIDQRLFSQAQVK